MGVLKIQCTAEVSNTNVEYKSNQKEAGHIYEMKMEKYRFMKFIRAAIWLPFLGSYIVLSQNYFRIPISVIQLSYNKNQKMKTR